MTLHVCPLCGGSLRKPWDPARDPWRCRQCGADIDVTGIGVKEITAKFKPR